MRLKDRVAIVTGGASGIGRGIATVLAAEGARVAVLDLNADGARETADVIRAAGGEAVGVRADVTAPPEIDAAVSEVVRRYGAVQILVNNAGWDRPIPFIVSATPRGGGAMKRDPFATNVAAQGV